jgi:thioesterase domain-containing protein
VDLDDNFFLLGGDSLVAVELFLRIEEALGRRLRTACLFEAGTISELAELLQKEEPQGCMIAIREEGNKPPFFCVHGFGGEAITFFNIARHLGSDQPFYGIESLGWDGRTVPFTKTADMAAHYVAEIQNIQPNGPYYLGGYSFGGRVAVYMANMLKDAGEEVGLLVLIDPVSLLGTSHVKLRNWLELKEAKGLVDVICQAGGYAYFKLRKATNNHLLFPLARAVLFPIWEHYRKTQKLLPRILRRPDNANRLMRMEQRKLPDYLGAAIYLQAQRSRIPRQSGELASWKGIVKEDLTVIPLACSHYEIVREPHSVALAKEIRRALDAAYLMATPSNSK